ncbi:GH10046 [Drosophila grimshawi]|uniref:GH10046 n=1 Tax=Drosophila grimshawi TaxID=7222 RepID=B4K393_DROGR|nr:GH10046 [Drosophila grimshawi]
MEEMVTPSASTRNEVSRDEDPNLSTAAGTRDCSLGLLDALNAASPPDIYMIKCSGSGTVRVMPSGIDANSAIQRLFTDKRIPFHSCQLKRDRGFRVVSGDCIHPCRKLIASEMNWPELGTQCVVSKLS